MSTIATTTFIILDAMALVEMLTSKSKIVDVTFSDMAELFRKYILQNSCTFAFVSQIQYVIERYKEYSLKSLPRQKRVENDMEQKIHIQPHMTVSKG